MEKLKFLVLVLSLVVIKAQAFTLNNTAGAAFASKKVTVNVEASTCTSIGISNEELLDLAAEAAEEFWNRVPTSSLKVERGEVLSLSASFYTGKLCSSTAGGCTPLVNNDILVACNTNLTNFPQSSLLGLSLPHNLSGRAIKGALILINDINYSGSNPFKTKSRHEKITILAHEMGHALGLGHSPTQDALMYYAHNPSRVALGQDDIDGMAFLYPAEQPKISGCGSTNEKSTPWWGMLFVGFILSYFFRVLRTKRSATL